MQDYSKTTSTKQQDIQYNSPEKSGFSRDDSFADNMQGHIENTEGKAAEPVSEKLGGRNVNFDKLPNWAKKIYQIVEKNPTCTDIKLFDPAIEAYIDDMGYSDGCDNSNYSIAVLLFEMSIKNLPISESLQQKLLQKLRMTLSSLNEKYFDPNNLPTWAEFAYNLASGYISISSNGDELTQVITEYILYTGFKTGISRQIDKQFVIGFSDALRKCRINSRIKKALVKKMKLYLSDATHETIKQKMKNRESQLESVLKQCYGEIEKTIIINDEEQLKNIFRRADRSFRKMLSHLHLVLNRIAKDIQTNSNSSYVTKPGALQKTRVLSPLQLLKCMFCLKNQSIASMMEDLKNKKKLINAFVPDNNTNGKVPCASAVHDARVKLSSSAFQTAFYQMNDYIRGFKKWKNKYVLLVCDGSVYENFPHRSEEACLHENGDGRFVIRVELSTLQEAINGNIVDAEIQNEENINENEAFRTMMHRLPPRLVHNNPVFVMDRGYQSAGNMLDTANHGYKFVIRLRDYNGKFYGISLPDSETDMDMVYPLTFRKKTDNAKEEPGVYYLTTPEEQSLLNGEESKTINVRVIRVKRKEGTEEIETDKDPFMLLATNIEQSELETKEIQKIYYLRWRIETSFRYLKCQLDTERFHSRTEDLMKQEIWVRLTIYNMVIGALNNVPVIQNGKKHLQAYNHSMALGYVRRAIEEYFVYGEKVLKLFDFASTIYRYKVPIRPGRSYERHPKKFGPVSPCYPNA